RHSGAGTIDVYAEASPTSIDVFVRDRGRGFEPTEVAEDRQGVRSSIVGRMERHGGTADVRSKPGEGTEVRLSMHRTHQTQETP
ncbi:MAG: ATPase, partial [Marmoricola sp.]|nr:ATPase [Marmoricola sp.]